MAELWQNQADREEQRKKTKFWQHCLTSGETSYQKDSCYVTKCWNATFLYMWHFCDNRHFHGRYFDLSKQANLKNHWQYTSVLFKCLSNCTNRVNMKLYDQVKTLKLKQLDGIWPSLIFIIHTQVVFLLWHVESCIGKTDYISKNFPWWFAQTAISLRERCIILSTIKLPFFAHLCNVILVYLHT